MSRGRANLPDPLLDEADDSGLQSRVGEVPGLQYCEHQYRLAGPLIGQPNHGALRNGRVGHHRPLDFRGADPMTIHLDHVVGAPDDPEVAVGVRRTASPVTNAPGTVFQYVSRYRLGLPQMP